MNRINIPNKSLPAAALTLIFSLPGISLADGHKHESASAHQAFTECVAVRMKEINIEHLKNDKKLAKLITKIPEGWTVVSGSGGEGHPKILLCR